MHSEQLTESEPNSTVSSRYNPRQHSESSLPQLYEPGHVLAYYCLITGLSGHRRCTLDLIPPHLHGPVPCMAYQMADRARADTHLVLAEERRYVWNAIR